MSNLHYAQTLNNEQFKAALANSADKVRDFNKQVVSGADQMGSAFDKLGGKIAAAFSIAAVIGFGKKVFETRAYFQDIESSMKVFLGSAQKAADFTQKLKDYAYYNMFEFKDLAKASQQLIAYGNNVDDVIPIMDKLSNIATGTKSSLQDMVDMYNKAKNLGSIGTVYLQQWASRGLVVTDVLKEMGEEVNGTKVSFEQLNKAIDKVTGEGGMFHGLMEEMMPNLSSSWGQLQDNLANMFDEIGRGMQESMRKGIDAASWAVDHYKEIGKVLLQLISLYGSYKAALITINALQKASAALETLKTNIQLIRMFRKELGLVKAAQQAFNLTASINPYAWIGIAIGAIAAIASSIAIWSGNSERLSEATANVSTQVNSQISELDELKRKVESATTSEEERRKALGRLNEMHNSYLGDLNNEKVTVDNLTQSYIDLKNAIIDSAIADARKSYTQDSSDKEAKKLKKVTDSIQSLDISDALKGELSSFLTEGIASGKDPIDLMNQFRNRFRASDRETFSKLTANRSDVNSLQTNLAKYWAATKDTAKDTAAFEEWAKGYRKTFETKNPETKKDEKKFQDYIKEKQKEYKEAKAEYERLKKDRNATKVAIDTAKQAMEDAAKELKDYGYSEKTGKKMTSAEKSAYRQEKYKEAVNSEFKERARKQQEDIEAETLAAMEEGADKERAALNKSKEQELYDLSQWQERMLNAEIENQRTAYKERTGKEAPVDMELEITDTMLDISTSYWMQRDAIDEKYRIKAANQDKKDAEQAEKDRVEYLIQYGNYQQQKEAIAEKYAKLIAEAENEWQRKALKKRQAAELMELEKSRNADLAWVMSDTTTKTKKGLEDMLKIANKLLEDYRKKWKEAGETEADHVEDVKLLQEQIDKIQESLLEISETDWGGSVESMVSSLFKLNQLRQQLTQYRQEEAKWKGVDAEKEAQAKLNVKETSEQIAKIKGNLKTSVIGAAVVALANGFAQAAEYAKQIAEVTGDTKLADWADQAGALAQNFQAAGQGLASGGWIGAIAGGVSDILSQTQQAIFEYKLWTKQFEQSIKNFRDAIELAEIVFDADKFEDMFGTRSLESAVEAYNKSNELLAQYNATVNEAFELGDRTKMRKSLGNTIFQGDNFLTTLTGFSTDGFDFGLGAFKSWFGLQKKTTQKWYSELDAYQRGLNKLQAIQVQVKKANGWAKLWGHQSKYKSLFDVAPEIWGNDINGEFDVEKAKKFLETSKQLTDEQRAQIENAIKLKEEYDKAQEALENVVSDTVGSFADYMSDAVWESLVKEGTSAWDIFKEKGSESLADLGKQMLKEFAISTYLEQFKEKLKTAYGSGDTNAIAKIYTEIFDGIPMVLENMTIAGQHWIDLLKENGYDITQEGATSGSTGNGYKTEMSHEDASEINGRLTDIQMQMRLGVASISSIKNDTDIIRVQTILAVDHLYRIEKNTAMLSSIDGRLQKIEKNTANL
ncbi:MAG: hypothetical protein E7108_01930 [Bacteroidales bacterium]|nr:hypothetical protein [Bacteroidales bacterium]